MRQRKVAGSSGNAGTVFHLAPPAVPGDLWSEQTIYNFIQSKDGGLPTGNLVMDSKGTLYGVLAGDVPWPMAIYRVTPPAQPRSAWTSDRVYTFPNDDSSQGGLAVTPNGLVYCSIGSTVFALGVPAQAQDTKVIPVFDLNGGGLSTSAPPCS